ncbi:Uncharacterised protein [Bordetella pertussis]|nr:Uncharacterised protein [Bordetella pertussis]
MSRAKSGSPAATEVTITVGTRDTSATAVKSLMGS